MGMRNPLRGNDSVRATDNDTAECPHSLVIVEESSIAP